MKIEIDDTTFKEALLNKLVEQLVYYYINGHDLSNLDYDKRSAAVKKRFDDVFKNVTQEKISDEFLKTLCSKAFGSLLKWAH